MKRTKINVLPETQVLFAAAAKALAVPEIHLLHAVAQDLYRAASERDFAALTTVDALYALRQPNRYRLERELGRPLTTDEDILRASAEHQHLSYERLLAKVTGTEPVAPKGRGYFNYKPVR